jgi:hypothetical protein
VRNIFHWQFSGVILPLALGTGVVSMVAMAQFKIAYTFVVILALWSTCWWLTSDYLFQKRKAITSRKARRAIVQFHAALRSYRWRKWAGIAAIFVLSFAVGFWAYGVEAEKIDERLSQERQDTYDRLSVFPLPIDARDSSEKIGVSITNAGHAELNKHIFSCKVLGLINLKQTAWISSYIESREYTESLGLLGGGRGESVYCHPFAYLEGPLWCVEMITELHFALKDQPNIFMTKNYRFYGRVVSDRFEWTQEDINDNRDICGSQNSQR